MKWTLNFRTVVVIAGATAVVLLFALLVATTDTGPTEAETARYERVRRQCTEIADAVGVFGRQRVKSINQCMTDLY